MVGRGGSLDSAVGDFGQDPFTRYCGPTARHLRRLLRALSLGISCHRLTFQSRCDCCADPGSAV